MVSNAGGQNRSTEKRKIRLLVVCMWPLGGIRTYLKYNYRYFPRDRFDITVLANPTIEIESFENDLREEGIRLVRAERWAGWNVLFKRTATLLKQGHFDLIHSHGFTSAFHAAIANSFRRLPHVLTMHGILEPAYFKGWSAPLKRFIFRMVLKNVTVFHAVSRDLLNHFYDAFPTLKTGRARSAVISSGVDTKRFAARSDTARTQLRRTLELPEDRVVFGYFGRFMPEKGFDTIIAAARLLRDKQPELTDYSVLAVGTGDYESHYKRTVRKEGLDSIFNFRPFVPDISNLVKGCDAVVIPSHHEAYCLLATEVLVAGIPVLAAEAMGLREAVRDTPAIMFPVADSEHLAHAMTRIITEPELINSFREFQPEAARRYDGEAAAMKLVDLFVPTLSDLV